MTREEKDKKIRRIKTAFLITLIIFVISFAALVARIIYVRSMLEKGSTSVVPDNLIGASPDGVRPEAYEIELYEKNPGDNDRFHMDNLFPGDAETKFYCVRILHNGPTTVRYYADQLEDTKDLSGILNIRVTLLDEDDPTIIFDGSFAEIQAETFDTKLPANASGETLVYYQIDVSFPTSAGNEYQDASLSARFNWELLEDGLVADPPASGGNSGGGICYLIWPWCIIPALSLLTMIILTILYFRTKNKDEEEEAAE